VGQLWDTTLKITSIMKEYQYGLAKRGKLVCPACGKKTFVPYVDASGEILDETVGKCDRADKCAYHYPPRQYFADKGISNDQPQRHKSRRPLPPLVRASYISTDVFKKSLQEYDHNNLVIYLRSLIGNTLATEAIESISLARQSTGHAQPSFGK